MNSRLNTVLFALVFAVLLPSSASYASDTEDLENMKLSAPIDKADFFMIEGATAIDQDDPFNSVEMSTFNDAIKFDSMQDVEAFDKHGSQVAGLAAKYAVESKLGYLGRGITYVTGKIAWIFGKSTLTEVAIDTVRSPFKIEGPYPDTVAGVVGKKTQAAVNNLIPRGTIITAATGYVGQKAFGTPTLTQGLIEYVAVKSSPSVDVVEEKNAGDLEK